MDVCERLGCTQCDAGVSVEQGVRLGVATRCLRWMVPVQGNGTGGDDPVSMIGVRCPYAARLSRKRGSGLVRSSMTRLWQTPGATRPDRMCRRQIWSGRRQRQRMEAAQTPDSRAWGPQRWSGTGDDRPGAEADVGRCSGPTAICVCVWRNHAVHTVAVRCGVGEAQQAGLDGRHSLV